MTTTISEAEKRKRLSELVIRFDTAMLVTRSSDGGMRARPLTIADSGDGEALYFSTAIESPKVREIEADPHVNVVMQDGRRYVSLSGVAKVVRDRGLIERLWSPSWKVWFPKGVDDPSLRLLRVEPVEAGVLGHDRHDGNQIRLRDGEGVRDRLAADIRRATNATRHT